MGHSHLNETLRIMGKHPTGMCIQCQEYETVEHVLISCGKSAQERQEMMTRLQSLGRVERNVRSILECAEKQESRKYFLGFVKETGLDKRSW